MRYKDEKRRIEWLINQLENNSDVLRKRCTFLFGVNSDTRELQEIVSETIDSLL